MGLTFTSNVSLGKLLNSYKPLLLYWEDGEVIYLPGLSKAKRGHTYNSCLPRTGRALAAIHRRPPRPRSPAKP